MEKLAESLPGKLVLFEADLNEPATFDAPMAGCSVVFQLAASVGGWKEDPYKEVIEPNCQGSVDVIAAAKKAGTVRRVVYTSSTFTTHDPIVPAPPVNGELYTEEDWNQNLGEETAWSKGKWTGEMMAAYGVGKTLGERKAWEYSKEVGIDMVAINPGIVIGPTIGNGLGSSGLFLASIKQMMPPMNGVYHLVDVRDVARVHVAAAEDPTAKGRYLCMYKEKIGQREFAEWIQAAFPDMKGIYGLEAESVKKELVDNTKVMGLLGGPLMDCKISVVDTVRCFLAKGFLTM